MLHQVDVNSCAGKKTAGQSGNELNDVKHLVATRCRH